eukprot:2520647-Pyramimonas_sp.AAC.1
MPKSVRLRALAIWRPERDPADTRSHGDAPRGAAAARETLRTARSRPRGRNGEAAETNGILVHEDPKLFSHGSVVRPRRADGE